MRKKPVFKYSHKDKLKLGLKHIIIIIFAIILGIFSFLIGFKLLGIVLLISTSIYTLIVYPKRNIQIYSRFVICGNTIFYYKNINRVVLNSDLGILSLYSDNDEEVFRLEKELFPTNARKIEKIVVNKRNKFKKVSDKIISNIISNSPEVKLFGVNI